MVAVGIPSDSKMHTATGPGITSILAVIRESNHAHFLSLHVLRLFAQMYVRTRAHTHTLIHRDTAAHA